jgi:hypothetical protein
VLRSFICNPAFGWTRSAVGSFLFKLVALMMVAARTSEKLLKFYQTTRQYNSEDSHLYRFFVSALSIAEWRLLHQSLGINLAGLR